jgi:hypothetical protein
MPWCDTCSRYYNPNTLPPEGACPSCGTVLAAPRSTDPDAPDGPAAPTKAPWHFKLLVAAAVLYLGWRAVQGIEWLVHHA